MAERRFLFLQGPHGPFFAQLARALRDTGAEAWRAGVNAGDAAMWRGPGYLPYRGNADGWPAWLEAECTRRGVTDIAFYGSSRPIHRAARRLGEAHGLRLHVFEEGYLRPWWITYERGGANADSPLMKVSLAEMEEALSGERAPLIEAPDHWGDMREHIFWGAAYHACLLAGARAYPDFAPHRTPGVAREAALHLKRLFGLPHRRLRRRVATARIMAGGFPYHLVLLQLAHDANFRDNSRFSSQEAFLGEVFAGFAAGAPAHHHLVLKAHPLEDDREPLRPLVSALALRHELTGRVHFVSGGKLAPLLRAARSAVTVNSTAAEQALWRGIPLKALGRAVYNRPEFVSRQPLADFFADPTPPDRAAYDVYRRFLLATSQVAGGFYSARGRRQLIRQLPDLMLAELHPADSLRGGREAGRQHIRLVT